VGLLKSGRGGRTKRLLVLLGSLALAASFPLGSSALTPPTFEGPNGSIVFVRIVADKPAELWRVASDGSGEIRLIGSSTVSYTTPQAGPRGKRIVFVGGIRQGHVWKMRINGSNRKKLTRGRGSQLYPQWSPDGRRIAYVRLPNSPAGDQAMLVVMRADGTRKRKLTSARHGLQIGSWSPDTGRLVFSASDPTAPGEGTVINIVSRKSGRVHTIVGSSRYRDVDSPQWSPSDKRIVFTSRPASLGGAASKVIVIRPNGTHRQVIASGDAIKLAPAWAPDGSHLAYLKCRGGRLTCSLWVARAGGAARHRVARSDVQDFAWSPNGKKLVYSWVRPGTTAISAAPRLYIVKRDGSDRHRITNSLHRGQQFDLEASWQSG
jgi:Tol biopolymer transport system component